jgi:uncharacterized membrane protein
MAQYDSVGAISLREPTTAGRGRARVARAAWKSPVSVFLFMSLIFGPFVVALTPPMRGADEPAHFVRAYGLSQGEIVPSTKDAQNRKGIFISTKLQQQMEMFELARTRIHEENFSYSDLFDRYRTHFGTTTTKSGSDQKAFNLYGGSEGYSPIPYLPYIPAIALARFLDFDFLGMIYLMRSIGFMVMTALMAYVIFIVPRLRWAFVLIAMLPSALFARATLSADGMSLVFAMLVAALALRGVVYPQDGNVWTRSLWMSLCALAKPPQIAFILMGTMRWPLGQTARYWAALTIALAPPLVFAAIWTVLSGTDVAIWRIDGSQTPAEHFDPVWKLRYMIEHPLHFPALLAASLGDVDYYGQQLIGVLGWLDTPLQSWVYPSLALCLIGVLAEPVGGSRQTRMRVGAMSATTAVAYCLAVFLIFYLVWTGIDDEKIHGVQGRYFLVVLPLAAITISALLNRGLPEAVRGWIVAVATTLSGCAVIEAVLRTDWKLLLLPI